MLADIGFNILVRNRGVIIYKNNLLKKLSCLFKCGDVLKKFKRVSWAVVRDDNDTYFVDFHQKSAYSRQINLF